MRHGVPHRDWVASGQTYKRYGRYSVDVIVVKYNVVDGGVMEYRN